MSQTINFNLELPDRGSYDGTWDVPVNSNFTILDNLLYKLYQTNKSSSIPLTIYEGMLWYNNSDFSLSIKQSASWKEIAYKLDVLNLTGGILTGDIKLDTTTSLRKVSFAINNIDDLVAIYASKDTNTFGIKDFGNNKTIFELNRATDTLDIKSTILTKDGNTIWHSGNDGDGTSLDAGKLQGKKWVSISSGNSSILNNQNLTIPLKQGGVHNYYRYSVYSDISCINAYDASPSCYYLVQSTSASNDALIIKNTSGSTNTFNYQIYSWE